MEQDKAKAVELYREAAEAGDVRAMCNLGYCYYQGIGTEMDDAEAFQWFSKAAEEEYPRAMQLLGECYENGYGVEQDEKKAAELYRLAHEASWNQWNASALFSSTPMPW